MHVLQKNSHVSLQALGVLFCLLSVGWIWRLFDHDPVLQADAPSLTVNVHLTFQRLDVCCYNERNEREPGEVKVTEITTSLQPAS